MSALRDAHRAAHAALDLAEMDDAGYADHLQHAVVVRRLRELVLLLRAPWVRARRPAASGEEREGKGVINIGTLTTAVKRTTDKSDGLVAASYPLNHEPHVRYGS